MLQIGQTSVLEWCIFIWAICSFVLYVLLLWMMYRKRHQEPFHNSFFKIFISLGLADIGSMLTHYPFQLFRFWGWISWGYFFEHKNRTVIYLFVLLVESSTWFWGFSQYVGITIMAFNRLRSVVSPLEIWSDNILKICYLAQWGSAILCVVPLSFAPLKAKLRVNSTIYSVYYADQQFETVYLLTMLTIAWVLIFVCSGLYITIYVKIRNKSEETGSIDSQQARKSAIRLAFMGSMLFIVMFGINFYLVVMVSMITLGMNTSGMVMLWAQWMVIFAMINPWLLLICSNPVRKKFINFVTPKKFKKPIKPITEIKSHQPRNKVLVPPGTPKAK